MNFNLKKWQIITGVIVFLLLFLNPSLKDFREFLSPARGRNMGPRNTHKTANFLLFSTFEDGEDIYLGVLKNFIRL